MNYAPAEDRKGRELHPGDRVRFKVHRGTYLGPASFEGVVVVSERGRRVMPDGSTMPALAIKTENGTVYGMPPPKGVLKIGTALTATAEAALRNYSYDRRTAAGPGSFDRALKDIDAVRGALNSFEADIEEASKAWVKPRDENQARNEKAADQLQREFAKVQAKMEKLEQTLYGVYDAITGGS